MSSDRRSDQGLPGIGRAVDRRTFLSRMAGAGGMLLGGTTLAACRGNGLLGSLPDGHGARGPLYRPSVVGAADLELTARVRNAPIAPGVTSRVWSVADGPTIETRRGARARILLRNELDEPTILHWHGLRPPEAADGHPRFAIDRGGSYAYDFEIDEPAGMYWYHSHAHHRTAIQTYMGIAGVFLVRDAAEDALGLPSGARELPLVLQDRRLDASGAIAYNPIGPDMMEGFLGTVPFVNGVRAPVVEVDSALYRLRLLAAANARIFRVALSNGRPLTLIGGDAGFLPAPLTLPSLDMATGERADVLADFSGLPVGTRVRLESQAFPSPARMGMGGMGGTGGGARQGAHLELLEFVVSRAVQEPAALPVSLPQPPSLSVAAADRERTFRFDSMMMNHTINGRAYDLARVDVEIPFGSTELWTFVNDSMFPHPVHMHAAHFQVVSRSGGRGAVLPWETGLKDTVLVLPGERVQVVAPFDRHRGLFLMHCHNLEHEDMGMMLNFRIV
jgi:FtsP/CotA-like multicopper oxidase with cupredoxin domain